MMRHDQDMDWDMERQERSMRPTIVAVVPCGFGVDVVRMLAEQDRCDAVAESLAGVNSTAKTAEDAFMLTLALILVVQ